MGHSIRANSILMNWFRNPRFYADGLPGMGLLFLRMWMGYAIAMHGLGKMSAPFAWMGPTGPHPILQGLAAASEFFGGIALFFGLLTPLAALAVMSVMFVATLGNFLQGAQYFVKPSPMLPGKDSELSATYFIFALTLFLTGPGLLSIDAFLFGRKRAVAPPAATAPTAAAPVTPVVKT